MSGAEIMGRLTDRPKVAGVDAYELMWNLDAIIERHAPELDPAGPAGAARLYRWLAGRAEAMFSTKVREMRAAGQSWEDIAQAVAFPAKDPDDTADPRWYAAVALFCDIAPVDQWGAPEYVFYRCGDCGGLVQDHGPDSGPAPRGQGARPRRWLPPPGRRRGPLRAAEGELVSAETDHCWSVGTKVVGPGYGQRSYVARCSCGLEKEFHDELAAARYAALHAGANDPVPHRPARGPAQAERLFE